MDSSESHEPESARRFSMGAMGACAALMGAVGLGAGLMMARQQSASASAGEVDLAAAGLELQVATARLGWLETMASPAGLAALPDPAWELDPRQISFSPTTIDEPPPSPDGESQWRFADVEEAECLRRLEELVKAPIEASLDAVERQTGELKSTFEGLSLAGMPESWLSDHAVDLMWAQATEWFEGMARDATQERARYLSNLVAEARAEVDRLEELVGEPPGPNPHAVDLRSLEKPLQGAVGSDLDELGSEALQESLAALVQRVDSRLSAMEDEVTVKVLAYRDPRDLEPPVDPFFRIMWPATSSIENASLEPLALARKRHEAAQAKVREVLERLEVSEQEVRVPNRARKRLREWRARLAEAPGTQGALTAR